MKTAYGSNQDTLDIHAVFLIEPKDKQIRSKCYLNQECNQDSDVNSTMCNLGIKCWFTQDKDCMISLLWGTSSGAQLCPTLRPRGL